MKNGKHFGKAIATILTALLACFLLPQASASYVVEGTPTQQAVSDTVESTQPVCYIGSTFYTSIEGALTVAGSNSSADTVYVIPGVETTISKDCTIAEGDTLCLPYSATLDETNNTYSGETYTNGDNYNTSDTGGVSGFADSSASDSKIGTYRKSLVKIADKVTLTIKENASLIVGGFTGYYTSGVAGSTTQYYCEILMGTDSHIVAKGSAPSNSYSIICYGYIKEATYVKNSSGSWVTEGSLDNGSSIELSAFSSILAPIVIYDYKGGSNTATMVLDNDHMICPFELFDFPNLQSTLILNSNDSSTSTFYVEYKLCASSTAFTGTFAAVGYSDAFVNLTSGSMSIKYTPKTKGLTLGSSSDSTSSYTYTTFTILGKAELNKFSVSITMVLPIDIDTSDFDLPISYRLKFIVGDGTNPASLTTNYNVKLLPGCEVTINKNASATVKNTLILYPSKSNHTYTYWNSYYITGFNDPYLLNNGTVTIASTGSFGGTVHTSVAGAVFDASEGSLTAKSLNGKSSGYSYSGTDYLSLFNLSYTDNETVAVNATGYIGPSENDIDSGTFGNENYTSASVTDSEGKTDYYWKGTRYYEVITVSVTVPGVSYSQAYEFSISYTDKSGASSTLGTITGNTGTGVFNMTAGADTLASYAVKKDTTFSVSASRTNYTVTLTATPASGTAQTATATSRGGEAKIENLSADKDWTITMST